MYIFVSCDESSVVITVLSHPADVQINCIGNYDWSYPSKYRFTITYFIDVLEQVVAI